MGAFVLGKKVLGLRLRTWVLLTLAALLLLWALLNVLFSTTLGTGILEGRIEKKIGLPCEIESVTWSPWAGVSVRGFELFGASEAPLNGRIVRVKEVNLDLSWASLIKGKKRFETLEVVDVSGALSLEQLKELMKRYQRKYPKVLVDPAQEKPIAIKEKPSFQGKKHEPVEETRVPTSPKKKPTKQDVKPLVEEAELVDSFEGTVIVRKVDLRFFSEVHPEIEIKLQDCGAEIPVWGEAREGRLEVGSFGIGYQRENLEKLLPLRWDGSSVVVEKSHMNLFGVDFEITAEMRLAKGLPIGVRIELPEQQIDLSPIYPDGKTPLEIGNLSSQNFFQGYLLNLTSFGGRSATKFRDLVLHDPKDGGYTSFHRGSAVMTLNSAGLLANDVRVIGEEDSVLMNGFVTMGGEAAATVRIVSSPLRADSHEKRVRNASSSLALEFRPLVTPDREYRDIRIESQPDGLAINLGIEEEWVSLVPVLRTVMGASESSKSPLP